MSWRVCSASSSAQGAHVGVFMGQQPLGGLGIGLALLVLLVALGHGTHLGALARQGHEAWHVFHDVFAREQKIELGQALGVALQLSAQKGFHGGGPAPR
jgi:hypothetical protein